MWPNRRTAFEAYARLRRADHFTIDLHRQGRCLNVEHVCFVLLLCATIYPIVGPACSLFDPLLAYEPCTLRYGARRVHPPPPPPAKLCNGAISYMYTHVRAQVDNQGLSLLFNFSLVRETGAWQRASLGGAPRSVCPDPQASRCSAHHANHTAPLQVEGLGLSFALVALVATTGARAPPPPPPHTHTHFWLWCCGGVRNNSRVCRCFRFCAFKLWAQTRSRL